MKRLLKLMSGLLLFSIAIAITLRANIGLAPWDVFHQGISRLSGISFGQTSILVGLVFVIINMAYKERIGFGTISNMILIGVFLDIIFSLGIIPYANSVLIGILMIAMAMILMGVASYLYISAGFGTGPRDGFMVAMVKRSGRSVAFIRSIMELSVLVLGLFMGGKIGIGTVMLAFGVGPVVQYVFRFMKFDVKAIQHQYL